MLSNLDELIRARIVADLGIVSAVSDRVYAGSVPPEESPTPWIYFLVKSSAPANAVDESNTRELHQLEVDVLGEDWDAVRSISALVRGALHGWSGAGVSSCLWSGTERAVVPISDRGFGYQVTVSFSLRTRG